MNLVDVMIPVYVETRSCEQFVIHAKAMLVTLDIDDEVKALYGNDARRYSVYIPNLDAATFRALLEHISPPSAVRFPLGSDLPSDPESSPLDELVRKHAAGATDPQ